MNIIEYISMDFSVYILICVIFKYKKSKYKLNHKNTSLICHFGKPNVFATLQLHTFCRIFSYVLFSATALSKLKTFSKQSLSTLSYMEYQCKEISICREGCKPSIQRGIHIRFRVLH